MWRSFKHVLYTMLIKMGCCLGNVPYMGYIITDESNSMIILYVTERHEIIISERNGNIFMDLGNTSSIPINSDGAARTLIKNYIYETLGYDKSIANTTNALNVVTRHLRTYLDKDSVTMIVNMVYASRFDTSLWDIHGFKKRKLNV